MGGIGINADFKSGLSCIKPTLLNWDLGVYQLMKKYIFPINYDYSWKWLGIIEYRLLLPIGILVAIIFGIISLFSLSFFSPSNL